MRFIRLLIQSSSVKSSFRYYALRSKNVPFVRVVTSEEEDCIKLSFGNSSAISIKAPKNQNVSSVLSVIKLKVALYQKREEIKKSVIRKVSNAAYTAVETIDDYDNICLFEDNKLVDERTPNIAAWSQASALKIGDAVYEVKFNTPFVKSMTLPDYIIYGCILRPHVLFECATFEDSIFAWYRSRHNDIDSDDCDIGECVKIGDGFHYLVSSEDVGCYLKVVCSPRNGNKVGSDFVCVSKNIVEAGPEIFPFEERNVHTKEICSKDRFRCISYNTLANMYVEKRRFPYTSEKARDVYFRKQLLMRELFGYNGDVMCLQEVQERVFEYDFLPIFCKYGYDGFYMKKGGRRYEGLATFFRTSKFRAIFNKGILLNEIVKEKEIFSDLLTKVSGNYKDMSKLLAQDTALQVVLLENKENPADKVLIANTHLYSNKDMPEVRLIQAALCINYLEHLVREQFIDSVGILFCGDFNSLPDSEAYNYITAGHFECSPNWKNNNTSSTEDTILRHNLIFESACGIPTYTNFTEEFQGCLDYIFYSKNTLEVTDVVPMPNHKKVIAQTALPSEYFPSDHIALICTVKWKKL